jgi:hypothetical protein
MGLPDFNADHDNEAAQMERELRAATRRDRQARKEEGNDSAEKYIRGALHGDQDSELPSAYKDEMLEWIIKLKDGYAGSIIRRTVWSEDNEGNRISGLKPFIEHSLVLELYDEEVENLDEVAEELVTNEGASAAKFAAGRVRSIHDDDSLVLLADCHAPQHFYIKVRRALLHPSCNTNFEWHNPTTPEEWRLHPSRKLDALVEILSHHLETAGAPALEVGSDGELVPKPDPETGGSPDKIVVYSAFPSSNVQLLRVRICFDPFLMIHHWCGCRSCHCMA